MIHSPQSHGEHRGTPVHASHTERSRGVGVPPRKASGSRFPLYSSLVPRCGVPLQSLTQSRIALRLVRMIVLSLAVATAMICRGQDSIAFAQVLERIDHIQSNERSKYFFDLDSVPIEVMRKLMNNTGHIGEVSRRSIHKFMAEKEETYQATDQRQDDSPSRKFLFGRTDGQELFFMYFHGGRGNHLHLVYVDQRDSLLISSFATLRNWETLKSLEYEGRIEQVPQTALRTPLVFPSDVKALHSKVYYELDLF